MDPVKFRSDNRAAFDIVSYAWASALHKQIHAGALTVEQAATMLEDASIETWDRLSAYTGDPTAHGITDAEGKVVDDLGDGEDTFEDPSPAMLAQPCLESLAVLMGMSVTDLNKLTNGTDDQGEDTLGERPGQPAQPVAAPPSPPGPGTQNEENYRGA